MNIIVLFGVGLTVWIASIGLQISYMFQDFRTEGGEKEGKTNLVPSKS